MKRTINEQARALRRAFVENKANAQRDLDRRQAVLSYEIDMAKNEIHYVNQKLRCGEDTEANKARLDALVASVRDLSLEKVELDYTRKTRIAELTLEYDAAVDALEAECRRAKQAQGEEVVVL